MKKKSTKVTSKQVAERAGVSQTTVSFVLNRANNSSISEDTRQRVLQAARELNYVPDMTARALARGRSNNIALVISQPHPQIFIDEYIPNLLTGLNQIIQPQGFRIIVEVIENNAAFADLILSKEVAGLVLNLRDPSDEELQSMVDFTHEGVPIVSTEDWHPEIHTVTVDVRAGVRQGVSHLIGLGHRRIACISYAPSGPGHRHEEKRIDAYRQTLLDAGIQPEHDWLQHGAYDPETGYAAMQILLDLKPPPSALFAMNDVMAFGAMAAIRNRGLSVPDGVAVVGYDGIRLAAFANPPLTTVQAPDIERGRRAGEMLIELMSGKKPRESQVKLATQLIVRESCGAKRYDTPAPSFER
jgi:LacI family transcriptional regulator